MFGLSRDFYLLADEYFYQISTVSVSSSCSGLTDEAIVSFAVAVVEQLSDAMPRIMNLTAVLVTIRVNPVVWLTFIPVAVKNNSDRFFLWLKLIIMLLFQVCN